MSTSDVSKFANHDPVRKTAELRLIRTASRWYCRTMGTFKVTDIRSERTERPAKLRNVFCSRKPHDGRLKRIERFTDRSGEEIKLSHRSWRYPTGRRNVLHNFRLHSVAEHIMKFDQISGSARSNRRRSFSPVPQAAETFEQRTLLTVLTPNGTISDTTPTITWEAVDNAVSYDLYVSSVETQTLLFLEQNIATTNFTTTTELTQGKIRVWVRANLADNTTTAWSPSHDFIIKTAPQIVGPGSPLQTAAQRRIEDTTPTIEWTGAPGTASFELYLSNRITLQNEVITIAGQTQQSTVTVAQSPGAGTIRLRLTALEGTGTTPVSRLTGNVAFNATAAELEGAIRQVSGYESARVSLATVAGVEVYSIQFYGSANPVTVAVESSETTSNFIVDNGGLIETRQYEIPATSALSIGRYQVFIRAIDASGRRTAWTAAYGFDISPRVNIISPKPDASDTQPILTFDNSPLLTWDAVPNATNYDIWVSVVGRESASQTLYRQTLDAVTSFQIPRELPAGDYVFWVRARLITTTPTVSYVYGLWSQRTEFSTASTNVVPQTSEVVVGGNPTTGSFRLQLTQVTSGAQTQTTTSLPFNATRSQIQSAVRQLNGFSSVTVTSEKDGPNLPETLNNYRHSIRFTGVAGSVVVTVLNSTNTGTFAVQILNPATRVINARPRVTGPLGEDTPQAGVTVVHSPRPTITWARIDQAARYEVWIDTSASTTPFLQDTSSSNSYTLATDIPAGRYTAWIRAISSTGAYSLWSAPFSFTASGGVTQIVTPVDGETTTVVRPVISWVTVPDTATYEIWIASIGVDFEYIRTTGITTNSYTPTFDLPTGNYRVWVRAIDSSNKAFGWSSPVNFSVALSDELTEPSDTLLTSIPTLLNSETHTANAPEIQDAAAESFIKMATPPENPAELIELSESESAVPPEMNSHNLQESNQAEATGHHGPRQRLNPNAEGIRRQSESSSVASKSR